MNTNNAALRAAVLVALGTVPVFASAATSYYPGSPITFAREIVITGDQQLVDFGTATDTNLTLKFPLLAGQTITSLLPLEVRLTLTNGAIFSAPVAANVECNYSAAATIPTPAEAVLQASPNIATFKMPAGLFAEGDNARCLFKGKIQLTSGSKDGNAVYDMAASAYRNASDPDSQIKETVQGAVVQFGQAYGLTVTPSPVTIDVSNPAFSQKFVNGVLSGGLGTFQYAKMGTVTALQVGALGAITMFDAATTLGATTTITLSGGPLQAGQLVVLSQASDVCEGTLIGTAKTAAASGYVTFSNVPAADLIAGVNFCYVVDGNTRISKGSVSFDATVTTSATSKPNVEVSGEKVAAKYYKNGTSIKILTIPDPTDTNNPFNIRIYNMGATDAGVYGTLYNTKGQLIGTANTLLSTLKPKAVKVMKATDLGTLFGVTTWGAGRAWLQIEGDSQQIRAQAYAKTGGVLVNMSDRVIEDSGTFKRADTQ